METQNISLDRAEARALYRKYKEHMHYSTPMDDEIRRTYQLISQGRVIIKALDSIVKAGVGPEGFPRLAICRADASECMFYRRLDGSACMTSDSRRWGRRSNASASKWIDFAPGSFPQQTRRHDAQALLPPIPIHLRPKRGLANYYLLWEAEWTPVPPRDPFLLRRIGKADLWLVVAAWDLTEVERAVLASRLANA